MCKRLHMAAAQPQQETVPLNLFTLHCLLCEDGARPLTNFSFASWHIKLAAEGSRDTLSRGWGSFLDPVCSLGRFLHCVQLVQPPHRLLLVAAPVPSPVLSQLLGHQAPAGHTASAPGSHIV